MRARISQAIAGIRGRTLGKHCFYMPHVQCLLNIGVKEITCVKTLIFSYFFCLSCF